MLTYSINASGKLSQPLLDSARGECVTLTESHHPPECDADLRRGANHAGVGGHPDKPRLPEVGVRACAPPDGTVPQRPPHLSARRKATRVQPLRPRRNDVRTSPASECGSKAGQDAAAGTRLGGRLLLRCADGPAAAFGVPFAGLFVVAPLGSEGCVS